MSIQIVNNPYIQCSCLVPVCASRQWVTYKFVISILWHFSFLYTHLDIWQTNGSELAQEDECMRSREVGCSVFSSWLMNYHSLSLKGDTPPLPNQIVEFMIERNTCSFIPNKLQICRQISPNICGEKNHIMLPNIPTSLTSLTSRKYVFVLFVSMGKYHSVENMCLSCLLALICACFVCYQT